MLGRSLSCRRTSTSASSPRRRHLGEYLGNGDRDLGKIRSASTSADLGKPPHAVCPRGAARGAHRPRASEAAPRVGEGVHRGVHRARSRRYLGDMSSARPSRASPGLQSRAYLGDISQVRRELADNFCMYQPNYDSLKGAAISAHLGSSRLISTYLDFYWLFGPHLG